MSVIFIFLPCAALIHRIYIPNINGGIVITKIIKINAKRIPRISVTNCFVNMFQVFLNTSVILFSIVMLQ